MLLHHGVDRKIHEFFINNAHPPIEWVHAMWGWLCAQPENPIFIKHEDLAHQSLPPEAGDRGANAVLNILRREGRVRKIHPTDRAASVKLLEEPSVVPSGKRGQVWTYLRRQAEIGERLSFQPNRWADALQMTRVELYASLRGLEDRGVVRYRAAERSGGVEVLEASQPLLLDEQGMRKRRDREYGKLDRMQQYTTAPCRRRYIVEYFGEKAPFERCGTCDGCRSGTEMLALAQPLSPDERTIVLKVLSSVVRMERLTGQQGFGVDLIAKTLTGSRDKKVKRWNFDSLSTYGLLAAPATRPGWTVGEVADLVEVLVAEGCLESSYVTRSVAGRDRTYKEILSCERTWSVMKGEQLELVFPHRRKLKRKRPAPIDASIPVDLMAMLSEIRRQLADARSVPAYVVASNRTLEDMARLQPVSKRGMLSVHGMGPVRFERYGAPFLDAIKLYGEQNPR